MAGMLNPTNPIGSALSFPLQEPALKKYLTKEAIPLLVVVVALAAILVGVLALCTLHGNAGMFKPLSALGNGGGWGLTGGGLGLLAAGGLRYLLCKDVLPREIVPGEIVPGEIVGKARELQIKENKASLVRIGDALKNSTPYSHQCKGVDQSKGRYCSWSPPDDPDPKTQFLVIEEGGKITVRVFQGPSGESTGELIMQEMERLSDARYDMQITPLVHHGICLSDIKITWSSDPKDENLTVVGHHHNDICKTFAAWKEKKKGEDQQSQFVSDEGYRFTLQSKGNQLSLHVQIHEAPPGEIFGSKRKEAIDQNHASLATIHRLLAASSSSTGSIVGRCTYWLNPADSNARTYFVCSLINQQYTIRVYQGDLTITVMQNVQAEVNRLSQQGIVYMQCPFVHRGNYHRDIYVAGSSS
jgi:hypothetical protein